MKSAILLFISFTLVSFSCEANTTVGLTGSKLPAFLSGETNLVRETLRYRFHPAQLDEKTNLFLACLRNSTQLQVMQQTHFIPLKAMISSNPDANTTSVDVDYQYSTDESTKTNISFSCPSLVL